MSLEIVQQLNNPQKLDELKKVVAEIIESDSVPEAKKIIVAIENILSQNSDLKKLNSGLYDFFSELLTSLKFVILFELSDREIISLIKNNFSFIIDHPEYDLKNKFVYKIRMINVLSLRDELKELVRKSLLENKTLVSSKKIMVSGLEQAPTVSNWLKDYFSKLGLDLVNKFKFNEYIFSDQNTKALSSKERETLKKILLFIEFLKTSSEESPALDESFLAIMPNNDLAIFSEGEIQKIDKNLIDEFNKIKDLKNESSFNDVLVDKQEEEKLEKINQLEKLLPNYLPDSLEYKAIRQEIKILQRQRGKEN